MFSIPEDMKFFRQTTSGNVVVMGSNTLKSFPNGPLKNRTNIVLTSKKAPQDCGYIAVNSLDELFDILKGYDSDSVYVIGGANVYKQLLPYCSEVLVTKVDAVGGADSFFENLDENANFQLVYTSQPIQTNGYTIYFTTYKNNNIKSF
jgi:dihydrofolate reductase